MNTVLIITGRYLPGYKDGGPVRTIKNLTDNLGDEFCFRILTCDRDHGDQSPYPDIKENEWNKVGKAWVYYTPPKHFSRRLIQKLGKEADIIYLCGCFNDYARNTLRLKRSGKLKCPVIIASMGLFSPKEFHIKYWKKKPYMILFNLLGLFKNVYWSASSELEWKHISNQVITDHNYFIARDLPRVITHDLPVKPDKKEQLKVVFVGRIAKVKHLLGCIMALQLTKQNIQFSIYGPVSDEEYWKLCQDELGKLPTSVSWRYEGVAESEEIVEILKEYHIFFLPSYGENYGHAILEAMAAGCPCIISNQTIWQDVAKTGAGATFEVDDYTGMANQLDRYATVDMNQYSEMSKAAYAYACKVSDSDENKELYRHMFHSLIKSDKMRVLFTVNIPAPYRVTFFNELGKYCDLTVLFEKQRDESRDENWKPEEITNFRPIYLRGLSYAAADAFCPSIIRYLNKQKYDMIVIGIYHSLTGMYAISYLRRHKIPFLLNSDGGIAKDGQGIKEAIKKHFISAASGWLSTGEICDNYLVHYGADPQKLYRYPFTSLGEDEILATPLSVETQKRYRDKLGIKEKYVLISVGQFIYRKGYDRLIKIIGSLTETYSNQELGCYIIGGKITEEYRKLLAEYPNRNIYFLNFMEFEQLKEYYYASDLFVLPTREDIWGLVVNEAMAAGLPVITTDQCVAGMEMLDDLSGCAVQFSQFEQAIIDVIEAKHEIDREHILQIARHYTFENMAKEHMGIFRKVLIEYES